MDGWMDELIDRLIDLITLKFRQTYNEVKAVRGAHTARVRF